VIERMKQCGVPIPGQAARRCAQLVTIAVLGVSGATSLMAQRMPDINAPIRAAHKAADATSENIAAQTGQALPVRRGAASPASGPGSTPVVTAGATNATAPTGPSNIAPGAMQPVTREVFTYDADSRRDPFFSLILTEDLRPLLSDLKLVGILYEASGRRSVAIMRDVLTNAQYRVNAGMSLGRMRVAQIKPRAVIFTVDEFGQSRQDSLVLVDSSKVRIR
jgi:hypothetical protein